MTTKLICPQQLRPQQRLIALIGLLGLLLGSFTTPAIAQETPTPVDQAAVTATTAATLPGFQATAEGNGLRLQWQPQAQAADASSLVNSLPLTPYGGYLLPIQTLMVQVDGSHADMGTAVAAGQNFASTPYGSTLTPAPSVQPAALDWEPLPAFLPNPQTGLPTAPLFVQSEGVQRGQAFTVLGFSPLYQDATTGEVRYVESYDTTLPGAAVIAASDAGLADATASPENAALFAPVATLAGPAPYALAKGNATKLFVAQAGMQQISGADLAAAGLDTPIANKLRLYHLGVEVPLHILDNNGNNRLNGDDLLRFYAPSAGDRYNVETVYWLVQADQNGQRMGTRNVQPGNAQSRNTAYEPGRFVQNKTYDSLIAGTDGDHWFHFNAVVDPTDQANGVSFNTPLAHQLPLAGSAGLASLITLNTTAYNMGIGGGQLAHRLAVRLGSNMITDDTDDWIVNFNLGADQNFTRLFSFSQPGDALTVTLRKGLQRTAVLFDSVDYLLPVQLNFGGKGASFKGVDGTWRYTLSGLADGRALYDITNPAAPQLLTAPGNGNITIQDGPSARAYLVSGEGTLHTPRAAANSPVTFRTNDSAHTIYIAPREFHAGLEPLVGLRQSQRYQVKVVDVQAIYDAWSYGMVSPAAIRDFLRFAVGNWSPAPIAAVMVGDGTWDPRNYLGFANPNLVPPYLADVDPWLGETACDNCYGQLDGSDPTSESAFLVDIWIGRFPVISTGELNAVVDKIVRYETATDTTGLWRRRSLQIVDDYIKADGQVDAAGNFPTYVAGIVAQQPSAIEVVQHYYNVAVNPNALPQELRTLLESITPWLVNDPSIALRRSIDLMNGGVGMVTYTGHSNHWQWAITDPDSSDGRLMGLWDVLQLNNTHTPFIALAMTCYTSQFPKPENEHFTLDEHLFLRAGGGAVAVWGPAGLSVAHGHDKLQEGFYTKLWASKAQQAKLGALTQAGYQHVLKSDTASCCSDVNRTFLLLGDPLNPARVLPLEAVQLPVIRKPQP